jgi:alanine-glyoxylate transaminase/serine-glyoxylate transaminase/serine-pyruvate transaminase
VKPFLELNTPFSTERSAHLEDEEGNRIKKKQQEALSTKKKEDVQKVVEEPKKMSNQAPHPALLIPGPIEFDDAVLQSMSHYRYAMSLRHPNQLLITP